MAILLDVFVSFDDDPDTQISPEAIVFGDNPRIYLAAQRFLQREIDNDDLGVAYNRLEGTVFLRPTVHSETVDVQLDSFEALRCLLLDAKIRFGYRGDELFLYMYEAFYRNALEPEATEDRS